MKKEQDSKLILKKTYDEGFKDGVIALWRVAEESKQKKHSLIEIALTHLAARHHNRQLEI